MDAQMALLWEVSAVEFVLVTLAIGGALAFAVGRSSARSWSGWGFLVFSTVLLTAAMRFLHFSLFHGSFFLPASSLPTALHYGFVDLVILLLFAVAGRLTMRRNQMARQYRFLGATRSN